MSEDERLQGEAVPVESPQRWLMRAALAAWILALPRAVLVLARYRDFTPELDSLAGVAALDCLVQGLLIGASLAFATVALTEVSTRRGWRPLAWGLSLLLLVLGALLITHRLPSSQLYVPALDSTRGQAVHVVALIAAALAAWTARSRAKMLGLSSVGLRWVGITSWLLLFAALLGRGLASRERAQWPEQPNVILISLDTLRPDRLQSYGYDRETSPHITEYFQDAWRFEQVLAPDSWTLSCHVSMLTGLEPSAHGVDENRSLAPPIPTLATHLLDAGYRTMAIVDDCPWVDARYGLGRGFELYRSVQAGASSKVAQAIELLETVDDRPSLMFLHCYDAHSDFAEIPYEAEEDHVAQFAADYEGDFTGKSPDGKSGASAYLQELNDRGEELAAPEQAWISDLYDAGIATLDRDLATLFDYLEASGRSDNTIVVLTSDHGEEFYEHGRSLHTQFYAEHLWVPLFIKTPDSNEKSIAQLSGLIDITPTILELCGVPYALRDRVSSSGRSLVQLAESSQAIEEREFIIAEAKDRLVGVRTPKGALVKFGKSWSLFDRRSDPGEQRDVIDDPAFEALEAEMRAHLEVGKRQLQERLAERSKKVERVEVSSEERERLRGLGYVGDE